MNIFWMWLIVNQIIRIINRQGDDVDGDVSQSAQSEDRGSEPSLQGDDATPLIGGDTSADRIDTDEERDILHISST